MLPVSITYFCYGWTLWLYLNWLPLFFLHSYEMDIKSSAIFASGVFFAGVVGDTMGGVLTDFDLSPDKNLQEGAAQCDRRRLPRITSLPSADIIRP